MKICWKVPHENIHGEASFYLFYFYVFSIFICIIKIKCLFFTFIFLFIWMQVWSLEKEDTPHSFSSNTHPLGWNQSPSPGKKLGVQRRPQRTPYPQEESLQYFAIDHITGVNANRGPIQSCLAATPDQQPNAPPWATPKESHIKLPVAKNRLGQVHPHCLQCLPLGLVDSHGKCRP